MPCGWPVSHPGRIEALRLALAATLADPKFQAEAKGATIKTEHIPSAAVAKLVDELMTQPPALIEAMGKYIKVGD